MREGKVEQALRLLKQATKLEDQISFGYGPPLPVTPSHELFAQTLLQSKKYVDAYHMYEIALKRTPNRIKAEQELDETSRKLKTAGLPIQQQMQPYFNRLMLPDFYR